MNGEQRVMTAILYAHANGMPLTAFQVWQRSGGDEPLVHSIELLEGLVDRGAVVEHDGWYAPAGTDRAFFVRHLARLNVNADKWRAMRKKARWLQAVPFVRAFAASGSLAQGTTGTDSDWDMFVIARHGRLYTTRLALVLTAWLLGVLRTKRDAFAPDTFCFNHYVTDRGLEIRHRSLYVAHALSALVPVHDPSGLFSELLRANRWIADHGLSWERRPNDDRAVRRSAVLAAFRRLVEILLSGPVGDVGEGILRYWQQRRVAREPATHEPGGRVIADDQEIEFHPRSAERRILVEYNAALAAMGVGVVEPESGLR